MCALFKGIKGARNPSNRFDKRKRTITRTFRIRKEWNDVLQEEAERQGVSVNVLVNKIIRGYALFDRWCDRYGSISLPQQTFREILEVVSGESLAKAGEKSGSLDIIDTINVMGLTANYDSFVYLMSEHFGGPDFARWFHCFHHTHGTKETFHLQHNLGRGWSTYLERYVLSSLKSLAGVDAETRVYDYAVNLKLERPRSKP